MKRLGTILLMLSCLLFSTSFAMSQELSGGRALSLKILQKRLNACQTNNCCSEVVLQLAGLTKVIGYVEDEANHDLILVGQVDDALPPLHLEDLIVAMRNAFLKYSEVRGNTRYYSNPGCSIDPKDEVLQQLWNLNTNHNKLLDKLKKQRKQLDTRFDELKTQLDQNAEYIEKMKERCFTLNDKIKLNYEVDAYNSKIDTYNREQQLRYDKLNSVQGLVKDRFVKEWEDTCGRPQNVRIMGGLPFNTHFAYVMVQADYDMKRLVDSSDFVDVPGFYSLRDLRFHRKKANGGVPSMDRFWFYPGENLYREDEKVVVVDKCEVVLLTEEEHLTKTGGVAGMGRPDPLAKEFADNFSAQYAGIAEERPIYAELKGLFRFVSLAKIIKFKNSLAESGLHLDYILDDYRIQKTIVKRELPGRSCVKRFDIGQGSLGSYLYFSCGGVGINIEISHAHFMKDTSGTISRLRADVLEARPSPEALYWDYPRKKEVRLEEGDFNWTYYILLAQQ